MASLDPTERAKVALAAGESLRVTTAGQCTVQGLSGAPSTTTTLTASSRDFGPYGVSALLLITSVSGRADYSLIEAAAGSGAVPGDGEQPILPGQLLGDCRPSRLTALRSAIDAGACTIAFSGDSLAEGGDVLDPLKIDGSYRGVIMRHLQRAFPACVFTFLNFGLGSRTGTMFANPAYVAQVGPTETIATGFYRPAAAFPYWGQGGQTAGKSWINHVRDATPDAVFVAFGMNWESDPTIAAHLTAIKAAVDGWAKAPSLLTITPIFPAAAFANQFMHRGVWRVYREWSRQNNVSMLDAGRLMRAARDGADEDRPVLTADNSLSGSFGGWVVKAGTATIAGAGAVLGQNAEIGRDFSSANVNISVVAKMAGAATTGALIIRARNGADNPGGPNLNAPFLRAHQTAVQLWDQSGQIANFVYTPNGAGDTFGFKTNGARLEISLNGTVVASHVSYQNHRSGGVSIAASGGTVAGGLELANVRLMYEAPGAVPVTLSDADIFGSEYDGNTATKYPHGGNGANHPSSLGTASLYAEPARELVRALTV